MTMDKIVKEAARLVILQELKRQPGNSASESVLDDVLVNHGIYRDVAWVREQMRWLATMGAVKLTEAALLLATLAPKGREHVEGRYVIEGVKWPDAWE